MKEQVDWSFIKEFILLTLSNVEQELDNESKSTIKHYVNHDEFEMAFECLFIEIMKLDKKPRIDFLQSKEVAITLGLDEESVFDFDFWKKFEKYIVESIQ